MRAQFGWDMESWYGQFMSVAACILGSALLALSLVALVLLRYEVRLAAGAVDPPALRTLTDASAEPVFGASIGDITGGLSHAAFRRALGRHAPDLPWERVLLRREESPDGRVTTALFFPTNGVAEAFALCGELADIPPRCVPNAVPLRDLRLEDGSAATRDLLAGWGIERYRAPKGRIRLAAAASPVPGS